MSQEPRRAPRQTANFLNIGVEGRKTGISVQDTGKRDEHGFEDLSAFFSPEKPEPPAQKPPSPPPPPPQPLRFPSAPAAATVAAPSSSTGLEGPSSSSLNGPGSIGFSSFVDQTRTEGTMQVAESSGIEPTMALNIQRRQASLPPSARSSTKSPFAVSVNPRRNASVEPRSSPTRQLDMSPIHPSSPSERLGFGLSSSALTSPIRKTTAPAPNGKATAFAPPAPKPVKAPTPTQEVPEEPAKKPAPGPVPAKKKRPSLTEQAVAQEEERMLDPPVTESSPPPPPALAVQQKKPTKRGLLTAAKPAPKPFNFDEEEATDDDADIAHSVPQDRDRMGETVSRILDDTTELQSPGEDVDMIDSSADLTANNGVGGDAQVEDTEMGVKSSPEPEKLKKVPKPRKAAAPEPEPAPKPKTKPRKAPTPEPEPAVESEDDMDDIEPTLLKKRGVKPAPAKKPVPTKAKKAAPEPEPEPEVEDEEEEEVEPQPKKRGGKQLPAKKAAAKVPQPELEEESGEGEDIEPTLPKLKQATKKMAPVKKSAPPKGGRALPEPEAVSEDEDIIEPQPKKRGGKQVQAKAKKAPVPEPEQEEGEDEDEKDEIMEPQPKKHGKQPQAKVSTKKVPAPEPEAETEEEDLEVEPAPKKRGGKQVPPPKKPEPAKKPARAAKNVPEPEPEPEVDPDATEEEEEAELMPPPPLPKKRGGRQAQPEKPAAKPTKRATRSAPEPAPVEPEPEKPTANGRGKGKAKAVEALAVPKRSSRAGKVAAVAEDEVVIIPAPQTRKKTALGKAPAVTARGKGKKPLADIYELPEDPEPDAPEPEVVEEDGIQEPPRKKARALAKSGARPRPVKSVVSSRAPNSSPRKHTRAPTAHKPELESMDVDLTEVDDAVEEEPASTRSRRAKGKGRASVAATAPAKTKAAPKAKAAAPTGESQPARGTQRVIFEKPPPAPRQQSVDANGIRRSTRHRMPPLEFWKGEKVEYALDISDDKKTIRMPQVVGIVRIQEDEQPKEKKRASRRRAPSAPAAAAASSKKRKRTISNGEGDESDLDPGAQEGWEIGVGMDEEEMGVKMGTVKSYPPVKNSDGEEAEEEAQLAFSKERLLSIDVANGEFKFVKTSSTDYFGTGLIEIPPGGGKRTKNSGKMSLVFYMLKGRATVTVAKSRFRVGKGGQFMVPRGNLYSIQNEYDTDAKMFFAQHCQPVMVEEDEEGDDE